MIHVLDSTIRREAQLLRFGTFLRREYIVPTHQQLSIDIPKMLVGLDELNKREKNKLARDINRLISERMNEMFDDITKELHDLTDDEAQFIYDLYSDEFDGTLQAVASRLTGGSKR